jgi:hypothetical protein
MAKMVTLTGQFCVDTKYGGVKTGVFGKMDFIYEGRLPCGTPKMTHATSQMKWVEDFDAQYGSGDWDTFEIIAKEDFKTDEWHYTGDYGNSDMIRQIERWDWVVNPKTGNMLNFEPKPKYVEETA